MSDANKIIFIFNESYEFIHYKIIGEMSLYTSPDNFIGRNIKMVLPDDVASKTIIFIDKCIATKLNQEYDYNLGDKSYHSVLTLLDQNSENYPCDVSKSDNVVMASITENN